MCWLQPQILKHITALRPERKKIKFLSGCLGDQKFWLHNYTLRGSEMLKTFLYCIFLYWDQKFWILSCVVWGIRNSESPVLFGNQKFWILSCVVWGIRNSESPSVLFGGSEILNLLCCLGVVNPLLCWLGGGGKNSESSPALIGGSAPLCCLGVRNSESSPPSLRDQKFSILSHVV